MSAIRQTSAKTRERGLVFLSDELFSEHLLILSNKHVLYKCWRLGKIAIFILFCEEEPGVEDWASLVSD